MPRYKFNVIDGSLHKGNAGIQLPDDNFALAEGAQLAREVKADHRPDGNEWSVEVTDGERVVAHISFSSVD